jgi:exosortase
MKLHFPASIAWTLTTVICAALLYAPTWRWLVVRWWYDPNYSHAFLVLPVALVLAWQQHTELRQSPQLPGWPGLLALGLAVAAHLAALSYGNYLVSAMTIPLAVAGLLWVLHGLPLLRRLWFPVLFLVWLVPFPWGEGMDARLQAFSAGLAGSVLTLLGIQAHVLGAQISLANLTFEVGTACSGLRSSMALLMVGSLAAYLLRGPRWAKAVLVLAIVPVALASNLLRLVSLLLVAYQFGTQVAMDYYHFAAGLVLFLCAVLLFLGLARLLGCSAGTAGVA